MGPYRSMLNAAGIILHRAAITQQIPMTNSRDKKGAYNLMLISLDLGAYIFDAVNVRSASQ